MRAAVTTVVIAVLVLAVAASAQAQRPSCTHGKRVASSSQSVLIRQGPRLVGCLRGQPTGIVIAAYGAPVGPRWSKPELRGTIAAFQLQAAKSSSYTLVVVDVAKQRICVNDTVGTGGAVLDDPDGGGYGLPLQQVVLGRSGSVAYVETVTLDRVRR